jgi:uncharacterized membrane protein
MTLDFSHPEYLLLLPLAWAFTWWMACRSLTEMVQSRARLSTGVRLALLTLLICALAGVRWVQPTNRLCTAFVVDVSDSIDAREQAVVLDYIARATAGMRPTDATALVAFGAEALLDHVPEDKSAITKIVSLPGASQTNIAAGLQLAMASFPPEAAKHIVLFTDGNENDGNSLEQALQAAHQGVRISVVPLARRQARGEALLRGMRAPATAQRGAPFRLSVIAESLQVAEGTITLTRDGEPVEARPVSLKRGKTVVHFEPSVSAAGNHVFRAALNVPAHADAVVENNLALAYVQVDGQPSVLVVENMAGDGAQLAQALRAHEMQVTVSGPDGLPRSLADCARYDSLVLVNVPAWKMTTAQMTILRCAVHDSGLGLVMVGGEESFGAGGYLHTPVEEALPVDMTPKRQMQLPSLTLAIAIDISGSMTAEEDGVPKIRLAAEAASAAVEILQPMDRLCVMGYDTRPVYTVPMAAVRDKRRVQAAIARLEAGGGGILAYSALREAYAAVRGASTKVKHIILCMDAADTEEQEGCLALAERLRQEKITVSVIGFGAEGDPHVDFHRQLAEATGGKAYLAERLSNLPQIFTRDVLAKQRSLFVEKPFLPRFTGATPPNLANLGWGQVPPLLGYVQTGMKATPGAQLLLESPQHDPVLAAWTYGLGRTVAFTADATGHWGTHWLDWDDYGPFWAQALRWTLRQRDTGHFQTQIVEEDGLATVIVEAITPEGHYRNLLDLRAHLAHVAVGGLEGVRVTSDILPLQQTGPGRYEATFPARALGTYQVAVEERREGKTTGVQTATLAIPYSPEFQALTPNRTLMTQLAERTHGTLAPAPEALFTRLRFSARTLHELWHLLVIVLACLFIVDIALRRLMLSWAECLAVGRKGLEKLLPRTRAPASASAPAPLLGSLHAAKARGRAQADPSAVLRGREVQVHAEAAPVPTPSPAPVAPPPVAPRGEQTTTGSLLEKKRRRQGK